jgi:hypothetical protein
VGLEGHRVWSYCSANIHGALLSLLSDTRRWNHTGPTRSTPNHVASNAIWRLAFPEFYGAMLGGASPATGALSMWKPTAFWSFAYGFLGAVLDVYLRHKTHTDAVA